MAEREQLELDLTRSRPPAWTPAAPTDTSLEAAHSVSRGGKATRDRDRVHRLLARCTGGLTDDEIGATLELGGNSVRPRRRELVERGLVADSGDRRKTATGRRAIVWVLTRQGREGVPA